jgi:anti-sigma factor RsiW
MQQVPERQTCQQITDAIMHYVVGEMDEAARAAFEAHLRICADCVAFLNTYRETIRTTRAVRYETIPAEMLNRVQQFLRSKTNRPSPGS